MHQLQELAQNGMQQFECFHSYTPRIREVLLSQIIDLRSSVVKEVCQTIIVLAESLREDFDPFAEALIAALLKVTAVTIQVR